MDDFNLFHELGLTKNEGKAYETLIKFGKLSAGEVSSRSEVPYSRIYDVLGSLTHKGLVEIVPEKNKKFIPTKPDSLMKLIAKKQEILENAKEKVKELKKFYDSGAKIPVIIGQGKKAFYKIIEDMKKAKTYNYSIKWSSEFNPKFVENTKKNLRRGLDVKTLARYDDETEKEVRKWIKISKNLRKIENDGVAITISDNEEIMISLIKSNVTLLIRDKPFVKIMKKLFLETYENAEKIN